MAIIDTIKKEQLYHRKTHNGKVASFYTTLLSEAQMVGKDNGGRDTTDDEVIIIIKKFIKNAEEIKKNLSNSDVRHITANAEIQLLQLLLPQQMDTEELTQYIGTVINTYNLSSQKDMGTIMRELKINKTGLFDGKKASEIARRQLSIL